MQESTSKTPVKLARVVKVSQSGRMIWHGTALWKWNTGRRLRLDTSDRWCDIRLQNVCEDVGGWSLRGTDQMDRQVVGWQKDRDTCCTD